MPRDEDKAWEFVERLEGGKWRCPHCPKESSGQVTRVKCHLLGIKGRGIGICTKVPNDKRDQLLSLLKNEGDPLLSLLKEEACSGEANRHSSTGGAAGTSCQQSLGEQHQFHQSSTMPSLAQNNHFIANERSASVHSPHYLHVSSDELLAHSDPQQASAVNMVDHLSWDVNTSHGVLPVQQDTSMPPQLQIISQSSNTIFDQSINFETGDQQQNQRMSSSLQNDQFLTNGASDGLQESIQPGVFAIDPLNDIPTANIRKDSYQPNYTFSGQHGGENLSSSPMHSTSWLFSIEDIPANDAMDPAEISSLGNEKSLQTGTSSFLRDCREPCALEVVNTPQHSNQPHPRCDGESGIETNLFPSQDSVGVDPLSVSQHSSDPHVSEKSNVNLQGPTDGINTAVQSIASLDLNRGSPVLNQISIYANHEKMDYLKRKIEQLEDGEADLKKKMKLESAESLSQMKPKTKVTKWLTKTRKAKNEFKRIDRASGKNTPSEELVERLSREVEELIGEKLPQTLFIQAEPAERPALLEHKLIGEAIQRNIELIWGHLMENRASNLGISGMGGVGKTTIVEHIHDRLLKNGNFDAVIFCTVSQNFSIHKLQSDIWKELKENDMEEEHVRKRAAKLSKDLSKKKNFVLILDDVWEHFEVQNVGIPNRADGCKLVLTTRSSEVCARMGCEEIEIRPLCNKEAWNLFVEHLGYNGVLEKIKKVAKAIVEKCAGLPLAIITMARSMRGEVRSFYWEDTLEKLNDPKKDHTEMGDRVLPILRHSYTRLSPQLQQCFLCCALYTKDASIEKMELIESFIDEGLIDELHTREKQRKRGLTIISKLQDAFLLEDYWLMKMHDLLREMALHIMSTTSVIEVSKSLQKMSDEECWTSDLERVSLMNRINEIPPDMSPNCPKLSTLLLKYSCLDHIPDSFFKQLQGLKVLNLSGSKITELPSSVSDLVNLRALVLFQCYQLCHIPYLGKLKSLRKLDASRCMSLEAVEGLQMLVNLRYLDLIDTGVKKLRKGTLRRLVKLQHLKIQGRVNAEEMTELKALELFECFFDTVDEFNLYVKILGKIGYNDFEIKVNQVMSLFYVKMAHYDPENCICEHSRTVEVCSCNDPIVIARRNDPNLSVGRQSSSILIPGYVQRLTGSNCCGMKNLKGLSPLLKLELLEIIEWKNLQVLCGAADEQEVINGHSYSLHFPRLKKLNIQRCLKLKYLFGHGCKLSLPDLQAIVIDGCAEIEGITAADEQEVINEHSYSLLFPCLKKLNIQRCLKLKYLFGHGCKLFFPDLQAIVIKGCEEIEGITAAAAGSLLPAFPSLETINVESCGNMKGVVESEWLLHFPNLKEIKVQRCKKMVEIIGRPPPCMPVDTALLVRHLQVEHCNIQKLLPLELLPHLRNLQRIHVNDCTGMEEIVSRGSASTPEHIPSSSSPCPFHSLPQLEHLHLENLPDLKRVCESTISCHSITLLRALGCPKLERISLQLKLAHRHGLLPEINLGHEELWDTLEWDGPNQDQLVLKFVKAYSLGKNCNPPSFDGAGLPQRRRILHKNRDLLSFDGAG